MYKIFTPIIKWTLAGGGLLLLGNVGLIFVSFDTVEAAIISHLALSTIALIMILGISKKAYDRYKANKKIVRKLLYVLIADFTSDRSGKDFAWSREVDSMFLTRLCTKLKRAALKVDHRLHPEIRPESAKPYIFISIKDKGDVRFSFRGKELKARGLSYGHECEIESLNYVSTFSLMEHEVGHIILSNTSLKRNVEAHHKLMREAGF